MLLELCTLRSSKSNSSKQQRYRIRLHKLESRTSSHPIWPKRHNPFQKKKPSNLWPTLVCHPLINYFNKMCCWVSSLVSTVTISSPKSNSRHKTTSINTLIVSAWNTRLKCAETGNSLDSVSSKKVAHSPMEMMNSRRRLTFPRTIRPSHVRDSMRSSTVPTVPDVNSYTMRT